MSNLWKYYTAEQHREFLLSLGLLADRGWSPEKQLRCLYAIANHPGSHYKPVDIPKRGGGVRRLYVPDPLLMGIQRGLLRNVLDAHAPSPFATAYRRGYGLAANAAPHTGRGLLLRLDIRDFFGSISYGQVYRRAFPYLLYPPPAATLLASLCLYRDCLPQGAPTSAAISNMVMKPFDFALGSWCAARGITYTRYCDDMTFSGDFHPAPVIERVSALLAPLGMTLNQGKTRLRRQGQQQMVTGVVVNQKLQAPRAYRDKLRQELYYLQKYGAPSHLERLGDSRYLPPEPQQVERYLHALLGRVGFVRQIDPHNRWAAEAAAILRQLLAEAAGESCPDCKC